MARVPASKRTSPRTLARRSEASARAFRFIRPRSLSFAPPFPRTFAIGLLLSFVLYWAGSGTPLESIRSVRAAFNFSGHVPSFPYLLWRAADAPRACPRCHRPVFQALREAGGE